MVAATSTGESTFGRMCFQIIRESGSPTARAASTNSFCFSERNCARTRRAAGVQFSTGRPSSHPHRCGHCGEVVHRDTVAPGLRYLDQSAMLYISESHGLGSTPLRDLATPDVAKVRLMS